MKFQSFIVPFTRLFLGLTLLGGQVSCQKKAIQSARASGPELTMATELLSNGLGQFPGALFQTQADSPIHWQSWTPETLARAKAAQRLIFGVIVVPQQPGFQSVLRDLSTDSKLVTTIHENYVPMLIDGDTSREMGLLTSVLCAEDAG
jgi:hypothetical protein